MKIQRTSVYIPAYLHDELLARGIKLRALPTATKKSANGAGEPSMSDMIVSAIRMWLAAEKLGEDEYDACEGCGAAMDRDEKCSIKGCRSKAAAGAGGICRVHSLILDNAREAAAIPMPDVSIRPPGTAEESRPEIFEEGLRSCSMCDEWYRYTAADEHAHRLPQSGPLRERWLASGLPWDKFHDQDDEACAWGQRDAIS